MVNTQDVPKSAQEFTCVRLLCRRRGHQGWDFSTLVPHTRRTV